MGATEGDFESEMSTGVKSSCSGAQVDVFAFGLVMLELVTQRRMDRSHSTSWPSHLDAVKDEVCTSFPVLQMVYSHHVQSPLAFLYRP